MIRSASIDKKKLLITLSSILAIAVIAIFALRPSSPDFTQYEAGPERKKAFFDYFLPLVKQRNSEIAAVRQELKTWHKDPDAIGWWDSGELDDIAAHYGLDSFDPGKEADWAVLMRRADKVPPSLALAQAANESAWGTSRFAREGNNYYGQWCFEEGCGIVPSSREAGKSHEVAAFDSPRESVERYIANLNSHDAYKPLRLVRANLRDADKTVTGIALAGGLGKYSERGDEYISELRSMMRYNKLDQLDQPAD